MTKNLALFFSYLAAEDECPLQVDTATMMKIVEWLKHHENLPALTVETVLIDLCYLIMPDSLLQPLKSDNLVELLGEYTANFINALEKIDFLKLTNVGFAF